jgi:hypothetical protein
MNPSVHNYILSRHIQCIYIRISIYIRLSPKYEILPKLVKTLPSLKLDVTRFDVPTANLSLHTQDKATREGLQLHTKRMSWSGKESLHYILILNKLCNERSKDKQQSMYLDKPFAIARKGPPGYAPHKWPYIFHQGNEVCYNLQIKIHPTTQITLWFLQWQTKDKLNINLKIICILQFTCQNSLQMAKATKFCWNPIKETIINYTQCKYFA